MPAPSRAAVVVKDSAAASEEPPPEVKRSATALQPATGKKKTATTSVFFDVSQPPGQAEIKQKPVAEDTLANRQPLVNKRAEKCHKPKFKSGEQVVLTRMMFLPDTYDYIEPYTVVDEVHGNYYRVRSSEHDGLLLFPEGCICNELEQYEKRHNVRRGQVLEEDLEEVNAM